MTSTAEPLRQSPFPGDPHAPSLHKPIPILPSSGSPAVNNNITTTGNRGDPMDVTPSSASMGPPTMSSPATDRSSQPQTTNGDTEHTTNHTATNGASNPPIGAAAAAQQPKVVQTAFIHKLYNMLEDQSIQHLISWSSSNESFVMSPSTEFSKVLSSYFKHTNISSFVRQLNMYGFHKVSDVFHTGAPDSPLWEFKHGNGSFKRGDLVGLREIKRRASRHALIHRDSFSTAPKAPPPPQGAPVEPMPDPIEARLSIIEHNLYDMHARLARSEETAAYWNAKCHTLVDGLIKCQQWNHELAKHLLTFVPDPENPIHKDVAMLQRDISRQSEMFRTYEEPQEPPPRPLPYANLHHDTGPVSPRQMAQDDSRRGSLHNLRGPPAFRTPIAPHLQISPRRYGSIGTGSSSTYSPSSARSQQYPAPPPPPPPSQHYPSVSVTSPPTTLPRRHTSADIRLHGWQGPGGPTQTQSPYASGQNSTQWPSSPHRAPIGGDEQLRNVLAQYELPRGPRQPPAQSGSRHASPPPGSGDPHSSHLNPDAGWQLPGPRFGFKGFDTPGHTPGPPTRRSSMASNVHSLLNPAETAEREGEDEGGSEDRKRKRMQ